MALYDDIPELATQQQAIARRQKIAEAMMQSAQQPLETNQMAGGYVVPVSPVQGLAKLAQAYFANKQQTSADQDLTGLADKRKQMVADELAKINTYNNGVPPEAKPNNSNKLSDQYQAPDVNKAIEAAIFSQTPEAQRYGALLSSRQQAEEARNARKEDLATNIAAKSQEAQLAREARGQELQLRLMDARTSAADKAELQRELAQLRIEAQTDQAKLVAGLRQPAAPTMTEVVDPSDPSRMLRVDAKSYKGGTLGSQGVLGISGKEPTAAKKEEQSNQGKSALSDSISTLRGYYDTLDQNNAIANPDKGVMSNIGAAIGSSAIGQLAGGVVGSKNQSTRDSINMQRPLLLQAIKQATGMSAKQMDSNAELKLWLAAATDPTKSIKANREALDSIERKYLNNQSADVPERRASDKSQPKIVDFNSLP